MSCRHRTHRNRTSADRCAILNCVIPQWVMPMLDQSAEYERFVASGVGEVALTARERRDADMVMQNKVGGMPIRTFESAAAKM